MFHPARICLGVGLIVSSSPLKAQLIVNPPIPVTHQVTVQPIIVSNSDGSNTAEFFGTPSQQASIEAHVDAIWSQAGIRVRFLNPNMWNDDFANIGDPTDPDGVGPRSARNDPRPNSDLNAVVSNGTAEGVGHVNPNVIDMYFVEIAAGFSDLAENFANGLAFVDGNGITFHTGDALPGFAGGREVAASVAAHEIGHNLGLPHIILAENLMQASGSPGPGERLNSAQMTTVLRSSFVSPVPEPSGLAWLALAIATLGRFRTRRKRTLAA